MIFAKIWIECHLIEPIFFSFLLKNDQDFYQSFKTWLLFQFWLWIYCDYCKSQRKRKTRRVSHLKCEVVSKYKRELIQNIFRIVYIFLPRLLYKISEINFCCRAHNIKKNSNFEHSEKRNSSESKKKQSSHLSKSKATKRQKEKDRERQKANKHLSQKPTKIKSLWIGITST